MTFVKQPLSIFLLLISWSVQVFSSPKISEILDRADKLYRSQSSHSKLEMQIVNKNWERTMKLEMWTKGMKKTFIYIHSPKKDAGIATLKKDKSMWNYFPKINKVIKVPPSMMMGSWMGSDFTNDDLVKESTFQNDYSSRLLESSNKDYYFIELTPKESSISVWGKIQLKIEKKRTLLIEQKNFNERNELVRTTTLSEIKNIGGKVIPTLITLTSHKKEGNKTIIRYIDAKFNHPISNKIFTRKNLQKRR